MKTFKILQHIEKQGLENNMYDTFRYDTPESNVTFVKRYFGGDFVAGYLKRGSNYIAFWDECPEAVADAIVTDSEGQKIAIFECE